MRVRAKGAERGGSIGGSAGRLTILLIALIFGISCQRSKEPERVRVVADSEVVLRLSIPEGFKLNTQAPNRITLSAIEAEHSAGTPVRVWESLRLETGQVNLGKIPSSPQNWQLEGKLYICQKLNARICASEQRVLRLQVSAEPDAQRELAWALHAPSPDLAK